MPKNRNLSGNLFTKPKQGVTIKETPLSASIGQWLDAHRIHNERINSGKVKVIKSYYNKAQQRWIDYPPFWMQLAEEGTPDRRALYKGRTIYIEVKQLGKKPTDVQLQMHERLRKSGAVVIVVDNFDEFQSKFRAVMQAIDRIEFVPIYI